ncbi:hypothetical protein Agabi119p4_8624 [Agaricus bisporus var. burnettii]|uniref:Uncharacterized protein n=1 Tax=Agaricus bisporus var. burnettii TaxID=192524 RepID=A0A8H7C741_AGABI|nr:hypothetical protein Agabi119p4_8624 [Agaricus bisporus var. burnettii]
MGPIVLQVVDSTVILKNSSCSPPTPRSPPPCPQPLFIGIDISYRDPTDIITSAYLIKGGGLVADSMTHARSPLRWS